VICSSRLECGLAAPGGAAGHLKFFQAFASWCALIALLIALAQSAIPMMVMIVVSMIGIVVSPCARAGCLLACVIRIADVFESVKRI
jgi:hypothetical protein